ncbi:hypothetical protein BATDEDRAFT_35444 [Batrachochytrium dendrobatidis JAM81]|uniref:Thioredoxin domain-containing protein n=2 Tax=Batrachochytrium dendrobatidis TaxID=109871 RepID=F4P653_BATDJ|nr:uncharacterized protein BATDEDRAFT_35444 [Batrachochytrium dendrobatidis JAM81]EGF79543.1 hypothetical protein BATDEDRAFT_35444 [Batrachochytrium dendrobatidis JAM81]KAK5665731.1 Thioredoxin-related transmembrane protein 1 [Batrachochytrium dendrobatidis]|eukprot:XP_006680003.1 hypothetical protein BATDEDRAFT_35444 [Batrachochytrium dendrobatidis JAM81]
MKPINGVMIVFALAGLGSYSICTNAEYIDSTMENTMENVSNDNEMAYFQSSEFDESANFTYTHLAVHKSAPEIITDQNYTMLYNGSWVVQLYQKRRCSFSARLQLMWPYIIHTGLEHDHQLRFANVEIGQNPVAATVLEIKSLPTLKLIQNGRVFTYIGNMTLPSILTFVSNGTQTARWHNNLPLTYHILSYYQLKAFIEIYSWQASIIDNICNFIGQGTSLCQ